MLYHSPLYHGSHIVNHSRFFYFSHGRNCTLWLSPESGAPTSEPYGETSGVKAVQAALEAQFPEYVSLLGIEECCFLQEFIQLAVMSKERKVNQGLRLICQWGNGSNP